MAGTSFPSNSFLNWCLFKDPVLCSLAKRSALGDFEEEVKKLCTRPDSSTKSILPSSAKKRKTSEPCSLIYSDMCADFKSTHLHLMQVSNRCFPQSGFSQYYLLTGAPYFSQAADELAGSHKKEIDRILKEKAFEIKRLKDKHNLDLNAMAEEFDERLTRETEEIHSRLTKHASRLMLKARIEMAEQAVKMGLEDHPWDVSHWRIQLMKLEDSDDEEEEDMAGPSNVQKKSDDEDE